MKTRLLRPWMLLAFLLPLEALAAESPAAPKVEPALTPDQTLLARIKALPDNTWMKLPPPKVIGDLDWLPRDDWKRTGGPMARDYSNKMAWMPDRKRAIYAAGGHNADKTNDVWEYDLASNTWICLYGADEPAQGKTPEWIKDHLVLKDGVLQTLRGAPARLTHSFNWNYDSFRRLAFMTEGGRGAAFVDHSVVAKGLGLTDAELAAKWKPGPYILTFDPYARKWGFVTENVVGCQEACSAAYIPELKSWWVHSRQSAGMYDLDRKINKPLSMKNSGGGYECLTAYDSDTKTVVEVHRAEENKPNRTFTYAVDTDTWKTAQDNAPAGAACPQGYFDYDSHGKKCVLYTTQFKPCYWIYDVTANAWTPIETTGDIPKDGPPCPIAGRYLGYYDQERDVLVHYNGYVVFVCRLKKPD